MPLSPVVVIPTYNEAATITDVVQRIRKLDPPPDVLVVDDASPDGTGVLSEDLATADPGVTVLHRPRKEGLGPAYRAGLDAAISSGYRIVAQMDGDGSHLPEELPALIEVARRGQVAIGSRKVPGGSAADWSPPRLELSGIANRWIRLVCRVDVHDATSGFRAWPAEILSHIGIERLASRGYVFQVETLLAALDAGYEVEEVPIHFLARAAGRSKLTPGIVIEALGRTAMWGLRRRGANDHSPRGANDHSPRNANDHSPHSANDHSPSVPNSTIPTRRPYMDY